jgi:hypothetical protein
MVIGTVVECGEKVDPLFTEERSPIIKVVAQNAWSRKSSIRTIREFSRVVIIEKDEVVRINTRLTPQQAQLALPLRGYPD